MYSLNFAFKSCISKTVVRYLPRGGSRLIVPSSFNDPTNQLSPINSSKQQRPAEDEHERFDNFDDDPPGGNEEEIPEGVAPTRFDKESHEDGAKRRRFMFERAKEMLVEDETLLTWAAIGQIRDLHESDPSLWTAEKIADSFPISAQGARRLLRSKRITNATAERIRFHDNQVRQRWRAIKKGIPGVVSDKTLQMLQMGLIKYLPLKSYTKEEVDDDIDHHGPIDHFGIEDRPKKIEIKLDPSEIQLEDGPFTRMYKNHLKWADSMKMNKAGGVLEKDGEMRVTAEELAKSVVFGDCHVDRTNAMQIKEFQNMFKNELRASRNRIDQRYKELMEKKKQKK